MGSVDLWERIVLGIGIVLATLILLFAQSSAAWTATCQILETSGAHAVSAAGQDIREQMSYEWCVDGDRRFLIERRSWIVDGRDLRRETVTGESAGNWPRVLWNSGTVRFGGFGGIE